LKRLIEIPLGLLFVGAGIGLPVWHFAQEARAGSVKLTWLHLAIVVIGLLVAIFGALVTAPTDTIPALKAWTDSIVRLAGAAKPWGRNSRTGEHKGP